MPWNSVLYWTISTDNISKIQEIRMFYKLKCLWETETFNSRGPFGNVLYFNLEKAKCSASRTTDLLNMDIILLNVGVNLNMFCFVIVFPFNRVGILPGDMVH
jgi:hypothetical protein